MADGQPPFEEEQPSKREQRFTRDADRKRKDQDREALRNELRNELREEIQRELQNNQTNAESEPAAELADEPDTDEPPALPGGEDGDLAEKLDSLGMLGMELLGVAQEIRDMLEEMNT